VVLSILQVVRNCGEADANLQNPEISDFPDKTIQAEDA
jgi:hypothetical protein